ncbi:MAG TPA: hypothetical protein VF787_03290 [Thermoanaerobaculia bacterium]
MADTVTTTQIFPPTGGKASTVVVHLTGNSDGTGESGIKKVDIATILNYFGIQPSGLRIEQVRWAIQGYSFIQLGWDRTAAQNVAMLLSGSGYEDFRGMVSKASGVGGTQDNIKLGGKPDPSAGNADNKGSILLTSNGAISGATYDITLWLRCEPNAS